MAIVIDNLTSQDVFLLIVALEHLRDDQLRYAGECYNRGRTEDGDAARQEHRDAIDLRERLKATPGYDLNDTDPA